MEQNKILLFYLYNSYIIVILAHWKQFGHVEP